MSDYQREIQLGPDGPKLTVVLKEGLLPDQSEAALYHVTYDNERKRLVVTHAEKISTRYAAVNGIENDLDRAAVVMLDKVQATAELRHDREPIHFTLCHLPERGFVHDIALSAAENAGYASSDAKKLLRVLKDASTPGHDRVAWSVHSRGADVFNAAVREANKEGFPLNNQSVAVYGGAVHNPTMRENLMQAGVPLVGKGFYNHPFDLVPQVVGMNTLNPLKLIGSVVSVPALITPGSPHTWHVALTERDLSSVPTTQWEVPKVDMRHVPRVTPAEINGLLAADPAMVLKFSEAIDASVNAAAQRALETASAPIYPREPHLPSLGEPVMPALDPASPGLRPEEPDRIFPAAKPSIGSGPRL